MTRDPRPLPGILARYTSDCPRCDEPIVAGKSRIVYARGVAIHCGCYSGQDDAA
jgi:hypothetical protein